MKNNISGWIILDKPSGITSAHAVAKVKRLLSSPSPSQGEGWDGGYSACVEGNPNLNPPPKRGRKNDVKIGHAGTLDPLASGILPLALGEATKTVPYMMDARKSYSFTVTWGQERDTDDCMGQVVGESDKRPTREEIEAVLPQFIGVISQIPPDYSAIKIDGKRAYDAAREGNALELKAREVRVDSLQLLPHDLTPPSGGDRFICHCGKGTYIRSLARDMGRVLGCLGHISVLRRLSVGSFSEKHAISLEVLEEMLHKGALQTAQGAARSEGFGEDVPQSSLKYCFLRPVEAALDDIPACDVSHDQAALLKSGQSIFLPKNIAEESEGTKVLIRTDDRAVAIGEVSQGSMKPVRVFNLS